MLLDEKGKEYNSINFSEKIQNWMLSGKKELFLLLEDLYGFSKDVYHRGNEKISLSKMTFSHQMVTIFFGTIVQRI